MLAAISLPALLASARAAQVRQVAIMARNAVSLELKRVKKPDGRVYEYHTLRWLDPRTGKKRSETLGRADDRRAKRLRYDDS